MKTYQNFLDEVHQEQQGCVPSTLQWLSDKANNLVIEPDIIIESTKRYAAYIWDEACKAQRISQYISDYLGFHAKAPHEYKILEYLNARDLANNPFKQ